VVCSDGGRTCVPLIQICAPAQDLSPRRGIHYPDAEMRYKLAINKKTRMMVTEEADHQPADDYFDMDGFCKVFVVHITPLGHYGPSSPYVGTYVCWQARLSRSTCGMTLALQLLCYLVGTHRPAFGGLSTRKRKRVAPRQSRVIQLD